MCIYNVGRDCFDMPFPPQPDRRRRDASPPMDQTTATTAVAVNSGIPPTPRRARRATSALFDARALLLHAAATRYLNQLNIFTAVYAGDVILFNRTKAYLNPLAAEWIGLNDSAWVASAAAASSDSSPAVRRAVS